MRPRQGWKQFDSDLAGVLWWLFWWLGVPIFCVAIMFYAVQDFVPAWSARLGGGAVGTFVADYETCGRRSCQWHGTFTSSDGTLVREDVALGTGAGDMGIGQAVPAVDTGHRVLVFPEGGGWDWLIVTAIDIAVLGLFVAWVLSLRRKLAKKPTRSRRSSRRPRRDDRFVIGPERRLVGRYVLTRVPGGDTVTARSWEDVAELCSEQRVPNVVIAPDLRDRLLEEWGPVPDYVRVLPDS